MNFFMGRFQQLKKEFRELKGDPPGRRFINYHHRQIQKREGHPVKKVLYYGIGFLLIILGFLLGFLPGAPGIVLGIPGLALVAAHSKTVAQVLDRGEVKIRKVWMRVRNGSLQKKRR